MIQHCPLLKRVELRGASVVAYQFPETESTSDGLVNYLDEKELDAIRDCTDSEPGERGPEDDLYEDGRMDYSYLYNPNDDLPDDPPASAFYVYDEYCDYYMSRQGW
ncbi:unnamed protein product [Absidia cylindrospora]